MVYLNFDLNDGTPLQLEELFGEQADLTGLVRSAFYEAIARGNLSDYYWEEVQSPDEQEVYETVRYYLAGEKEFFFTPSEIYFVDEDYNAYISMLDHASDITVYHKFLTDESLFERDDIGYKRIFTCAEIPQAYDRREFGYLEDNFWYDIALSEPYFGSHIDEEMQRHVLEFSAVMFEGLMAEVDALRQTARENPDQMYILFINPYFNVYSHSEYVDGYWENTPSMAVSYMEYYKRNCGGDAGAGHTGRGEPYQRKDRSRHYFYCFFYCHPHDVCRPVRHTPLSGVRCKGAVQL
jgi:hypothetical protein